MWDDRAGGNGLDAALGNHNMGRYKLTRTTAYGKTPGDARILYDPKRVQMTSSCNPATVSCAIVVPDTDGTARIAAYARFKDLATGREFWFVSAHLTSGNNARTDDLRGRQAQAIIQAMNTINRNGLPIIFGADLNSSQTSKGHDAPHVAFLQAGYYNTTAAATQTNLDYNSVNAYETPQKPSNYGFGSMLDSILTLHLPGATHFKQWRTGTPYPSDHNLISADLRLL
jgi:endonuclease/exonuclease/phosphatase family metal-dependent hydrolase